MTDREHRDDEQVLHELTSNERIVTHSKLGTIRLTMPTLEIQRKIESVARMKRKILREATDIITTEDGLTKHVPAFRSREQLTKEYRESGWWTDEHITKLKDLTTKHLSLLTELEILEFVGEEDIRDQLASIRDDLFQVFKKDNTEDLDPTLIVALTHVGIVGLELSSDDQKVIFSEAPSTEVDDLLEEANIYQRQYKVYVQLADIYTQLTALQSEYNSLFSDSWQEQLQYFVRLAQVFYCTELVDNKKPIWPTLEAIEQEKDIGLVRWVFGELNAFWQGISDEVREKLNKYSFTNLQSTEKSSTEDSPALEPPLVVGEPLVSEQTSSSEVTVTAVP